MWSLDGTIWASVFKFHPKEKWRFLKEFELKPPSVNRALSSALNPFGCTNKIVFL